MTFSVLTATEGARLRRRIGDTVSGDEKLSDTILDALHTESGEDLDITTVLALQELYGIYAMQVNINDPQGDVGEDRNTRSEKIKGLLDYWEGKTGLAGGVLTMGHIDYNIDTDMDDLD